MRAYIPEAEPDVAGKLSFDVQAPLFNVGVTVPVQETAGRCAQELEILLLGKV